MDLLEAAEVWAKYVIISMGGDDDPYTPARYGHIFRLFWRRGSLSPSPMRAAWALCRHLPVVIPHE